MNEWRVEYEESAGMLICNALSMEKTGIFSRGNSCDTKCPDNKTKDVPAGGLILVTVSK